jgi:hypothetical protein
MTYLVLSGYMWDRKEPFANWFPALLTYLGRLRENEAGCGARVIVPELYDLAEDGERDGLSELQRAEVEEFGGAL